MSLPSTSFLPAWMRQERVRQVGGLLLLATVHVVFVVLSRSLTEPQTREASFWLPSGLMLGVLLVRPWREWGWIAATVTLSGAVGNSLGPEWPWTQWGVVKVGNVLTDFVGAGLILRLVSRRPALTSVAELVGVILLGGMVAQTITATVGAGVVRWSGSATPYASIWASWYTSNVLGVILITPLILVWQNHRARPLNWRWTARTIETLVMLAGVAACVWWVVVGQVIPGTGLRYMLFPFVLWAAIRLGPRGLTLVTLVVALLLGWMSWSGHGQQMFVTGTSHERLLQLQLALSFLGFFGLIPAIVIEAHGRTLGDLRAQKALQQAIYDSDPDCVKVLSPEVELLEMNRTGLGFLEVGNVAEARAHGLANFLPPEFQGVFVGAVKATVQGEKRFITYRIRGAGGTSRWLETQFAPLRDEAGQVIGVVGVSRDVTESRQRDEELRLARFTVERSTLPMVWYRPDGTVAEANDAACGMLGYSREEMKALRVTDIDVEFAAGRMPENWASLPEAQSRTIQSRHRRKDGVLIDVEVSIHLLKVGDQELSCAFVQDVTARNQAEVVRRNREEELRLILSAVGEGIVTQNERLEIIQCNQAAERILGLTADQMAGRTSFDPRWAAVHENGEPFPGETHPAAVALRTGESVRNVIMGVHKPDGSLTWISINAEPLHNTAGEVTMAVCSFSDVTASRALQEQMRQTQKLEVVGQLAGGVAHDFNNILTAMTLNLQAIDLHPSVPEAIKRPLDELRAMARRAAHLTERLLLFARRGVVKREPGELNTIVSGVVTMLGRVLGETVRVDLQPGPGPLPLVADVSMLDQVVMNLCLNARDAMPDGGLLTIRTMAVERPGDRQGRWVALQVADTGHGMSPEIMSRVFEPFFTTKTVGQGTGLGLAMVHGIVQQHGGWIEVVSREGQGSTFTVYLPRAADEAGAQVSEPLVEAPEIPRGSATILLVEDERPVREIVGMMLEELGYRVVAAEHGPEALQLWRQYHDEIALLITDMVMPGGMSGLELGSRLRREKAGLPFIVMSGYAQDVLERDRLGATDVRFMAKPFEFSTLAGLVRDALGEAAAID